MQCTGALHPHLLNIFQSVNEIAAVISSPASLHLREEYTPGNFHILSTLDSLIQCRVPGQD
jgi:hypothetical protein